MLGMPMSVRRLDYTLNTSITEPKADEDTIDKKLSNGLQRLYGVAIPDFTL